MLMERKWPRFEDLSSECYQGSHTSGLSVGLGRHNPLWLMATEARLGWFISLSTGVLVET